MKTIIEEPSSTGDLYKVVIHSLSICYFVNTPLMLNGAWMYEGHLESNAHSSI